MARITRQPADEVAAATKGSPPGTDTDVALGTFVGVGRSVAITATYVLDCLIDSGANGDTATVTSRIEYSTDGGSVWATLAQAQAVMIVAAHPEQQTDTLSDTSTLQLTGDIDLSQIQLRAYVDVAISVGTPTISSANNTADLSDWEITHEGGGAIMWT